MTSAVRRLALRSSVLELKAGVLLAAHRFNRDPEHGLSAHPCQMGTNFIITFFQLCLNKKEKKKEKRRIDSKSHIQSSSTSSFPLTSYLISDIMGKPDLYERLLKDSWKKKSARHEKRAPRAARLLRFKMILIKAAQLGFVPKMFHT